jgi:hypothetical protein
MSQILLLLCFFDDSFLDIKLLLLTSTHSIDLLFILLLLSVIGRFVD